jgi:threonine synthase
MKHPLAPEPCRATQRCINPRCAAEFPVLDTLVACRKCGNLLDLAYTWPASFPSDWSWVARRAGVPRAPAPSRSTGPRVPLSAAAKAQSELDASGVWRFRELLPFFSDPAQIVTIGEGKTILQRADALARELGFNHRHDSGGLYLQYEGLNPSGSFKDNGMTAAFTHARMVGARVVACASTGNTSASMALYASLAGEGGRDAAATTTNPITNPTPPVPMKAVIFIGDGKIAFGKLSQALDYGALTLQVAGDFDACLARVRHIAENVKGSGVYLMNSVNPFRLEGQKAVMFRALEALHFEVPDWVIVPGGNLGNCSAFGKAFIELRALGLVDRVPRLAVINASGARTLDRLYNGLNVRWNNGHYFGSNDEAKVNAEYARMDAANERAKTIASAIEINRPVNLPKALRALETMGGPEGRGGVVRAVTDDTIREYKALVGRYGLGCEPASAASLAGAHQLLREGIIQPHERVVCILTGHVLKDPDVTVNYHMAPPTTTTPTTAAPTPRRLANAPIKVADDLNAILKAMGLPTT